METMTSPTPSDRRQLVRLGAFHTVLAMLQAVMALALVAMLIDSPAAPGAWSAKVSWTLAFSVPVLAALTFAAGRRLVEHQAYSFCLTIAALNCFYFPFGTILGIWTLITLKRPSVRKAFPQRRSHYPNIDTWENRRLP